MQIWRLIVLVFVAITFSGFAPSTAFSKNVTVRQKTKYYTISGTTAKEFAYSMSKNGPYSFQHRKRAWATASRDMSYSLLREKTKNGCRLKSVKVSLKITYTMPKLRSGRKVSKRELRKWKRMYALLDKHEKVHGSYYRQLANSARRSLLRIKKARTCRQLDTNARKIMKKLSRQDSVRNDAFDRKDKRNYRRMERIYARK
ncbi:MAG: hypothetical protein COC23_03930 [Hyphomicrobiales bacterium]|nr:MAG: hypothetical protein COC23_03930 [Hyphomicrobiales bacterium]